MKENFTADQFTATQWDSASQKAKFANHFVRFVNSGFKASLFYDWFYKRLSMTFGHIAHYDRNGFYAEWFMHDVCHAEFIKHTLRHPCYGDPTFTYSDVEKALQHWLIENKVLEQMQAKRDQVIETAERAELARLKEKYEGAGTPSPIGA